MPKRFAYSGSRKANQRIRQEHAADTAFVAGRQRAAWLRRAVGERRRCEYCGERLDDGWREATVDHVVPLARGGADDPSNWALACRACNHHKNNRTPEEAGMMRHGPGVR